MNEQKVQDLLRRYFDGATSIDEERELQQYFSEENIPDSLKAYRPMFAFFAVERAVEPPVRQSARTIRLNWTAVGVAASIAILFLVGWPKTPETHEQYAYYVDGQRVYNEMAAMELADDKLQMLSASMQKAKSSMSAFEKVQESNQSLQQFSKISNAYRQIEEVGFKLQDVTSNN